MQLSDQYSTPCKGSSAGSDPRLLVPLPVHHPPDQSCIVPASAAESSDKHVKQISATPVTCQGSATPYTLPRGPWIWCHVYARRSSQCCLVFPFPPPPTVSLPSLSLSTPPPNTRQAVLIWTVQSISAKMSATVELYRVHERKGMRIRY